MAQSREVPSFEELMWPTLEALKSTGGSASNQELLTKVVQLMNLPEEIQNVPYRNGTLIEDRLHWARSYLRKVGAIDSSERGVWSITPAGRALTEADMQKLVAQVRGMSRQNHAQPEERRQETADDDQLDEVWRDQLLSILQTMPPDAFERLAQRILRESGFIDVEVKGKCGDGGIDGIGILRVGLLAFRVFFQCKRYKGSVSAGAIRDFRGAMVGRTDKGLFITTGHFTADAKREATRDGAPPDRADRWRAAVRPSEVPKARVEDGIGRARHRYSRNIQGVRAFEVTSVYIESSERSHRATAGLFRRGTAGLS